MTPTSRSDNVSVRWTGFIFPPTSESYTISIRNDDSIVLNIGTNTKTLSNGSASFAWQLTNDMTTFETTFIEFSGYANYHINWSTATLPDEAIPASVFWHYVGRLNDSVYEAEVVPDEIISVIDYHPETIEKQAYTVILDSERQDGNAHDNPADSYEIEFTCKDDGGVDEIVSTATYVTNGRFEATFYP